tara:strand:- start:344 stop:637 length:294 start_codon:yes stop_codon:yes gene_type:complete
MGGEIPPFSLLETMQADELKRGLPVILDDGREDHRIVGNIAFICDEYITIMISTGCRVLCYPHEYQHLSINNNGQFIQDCGVRTTARYADPSTKTTS